MNKNFRVIGRCAEMQMLSWDETFKMCDEVPYVIDFLHVPSIVPSDETTVNDISAIAIMRAILNPPAAPALPEKTEQYFTADDWENIDKQGRKMAETDEWKEQRSKKVSPKKAIKNFKKTLKGLGIYD